jgi:hypothetical protein
MVRPRVTPPLAHAGTLVLTCEGCYYNKVNYCMQMDDLISTDLINHCGCTDRIEENTGIGTANLLWEGTRKVRSARADLLSRNNKNMIVR